MNYYRFLDSRDIRNHLENMEYPLSTPKAAYLVWQCRRATLSEKIQAWETIQKTMPDCSMEERMNMMAIPSFHRFLQEYLEAVRKLLKLLQKARPVLHIPVVLPGRIQPRWVQSLLWRPISTYKDCVKAAMDAVCNRQWMPENIPLTVEIIKCESDNALIRAFLNRKGTLLSMDCSGTILSEQEQEMLWAFAGMWFDFPTPFQRGDLLIQKTPPYLYVQRPCASLRRYFVLESLSTWDNSQMAKHGFSAGELSRYDYHRIVKRLQNHGDYTDMSFLAYFLEDGKLVWDNRSWYLSLERYTGPLPENQRLLQSISDTIQGRTGLMALLKDLRAREARRLIRQWGMNPEELSKGNT